MTLLSLRSTIGWIALLFLLLAAMPRTTSAQVPPLAFPPVPCDSTACDSVIVINNQSAALLSVTRVIFRDGVSFNLGQAAVLPIIIPAQSRAGVPICFTPRRRGPISDSAHIVLSYSDGRKDTLHVRMAGIGIGPALEAIPNVLNFPKTNPGLTSTMTLVLHNNGEEPYTLDASQLTIPLPFLLVTGLPVVIGAHDSITITVSFKPDSSGVYSEQIDMASGCYTRLQIGFNGVTDLVGTGAIFRQSKSAFNPVNNEQINCDSLRCGTYTISNAGNAPLLIEDMRFLADTAGYIITNPVPTPFYIQPQASKEFTICISSRQRGYHRDTLRVVSNSRSSIAFGMVIDASLSMEQDMDCGGTPSPRMEQAILQARAFIQKALLNLPAVGVQDQLAVTSYTTKVFTNTPDIRDIFPLQYITPTSRQKALDTVARLRPTQGTPTGQAMDHMISIIGSSPIQNRVIILLTDGETNQSDLNNYPVNTIAARAQARGIRIFTIGIGLNIPSAQAYLRSLSGATGGASYDASDNDCSTLQKAFEAIIDLLSRGSVTNEPFQVKILAPFLVTGPFVYFDSVYVHGTNCRVITLTNIGEGTAIIDSAVMQNLLGTATTEFAPAPGTRFPIKVAEGDQVQLTLCFTPDTIRRRNGTAIFFYTGCGSPAIPVMLVGDAYAATNLRITDERIGLPGELVSMPVYCDSSLAAYAVNSITYRVRWNKSMLDLKGVRPSAGAAGGVMRISKPVEYDAHYASVEITADGAGLPGAGELGLLDFMVLRGDSLGSTVELTAGNFADNNPRTSLVNAGMIAFDSVCFRHAKPISFGTNAKVSFGEARPVPARSSVVTLPVSTDAKAVVTYSVFAATGELVRQPQEVRFEPGTGTIAVDMAGAASGTYYIVLELPDGSSAMRKVMLVR